MQEHNELTPANNNEVNTTSLQPMHFTSILDGMFSLYGRHFELFFGIIAVYLVLGLAIDQVPALFSTGDAVSFTNVVVSVFAGSCKFIVTILVGAGLTYASAQVYLGRAITSAEALQQASQRFWTYFGASMLWGLVVGGLFATIIGIPFAIYFWVQWGLYGVPVMCEGSKSWNALGRSTELVRGSWWRVFAITLVITLVTFMIVYVLQNSLDFVLSKIGIAAPEEPTTSLETLRRFFISTVSEIGWFAYTIRGLVQLCITAFLMPIGRLGFTLLYFDQRIRKEGFGVARQVTD
jgi:hypothetical protein